MNTIESVYRDKKLVAYFKNNKIVVDVYNKTGRKINSILMNLNIGEK